MWSGVRRGLKFGALAGMAIWLCLQLLMLNLVLFVPKIRAQIMADLTEYERPILTMIGSTAATFGLIAIYGAFGGAVVMGTCGNISRRPIHTAGIKLTAQSLSRRGDECGRNLR
jgi:hypothetical protein